MENSDSLQLMCLANIIHRINTQKHPYLLSARQSLMVMWVMWQLSPPVVSLSQRHRSQEDEVQAAVVVKMGKMKSIVMYSKAHAEMPVNEGTGVHEHALAQSLSFPNIPHTPACLQWLHKIEAEAGFILSHGQLASIRKTSICSMIHRATSISPVALSLVETL